MSSETAKSASLSPAEFRRACAQFATGITVVTTRAGDGSPHGFTANSFTSVSAEPPLVLVCIDLRSSILTHFLENEHIAINVLAEDQQAHSVRFAELPEGRFEGVKWRSGQNGMPILDDVVAALECRVTERINAGDHVILLAEVVRAEVPGGRPLLYVAHRYQRIKTD